MFTQYDGVLDDIPTARISVVHYNPQGRLCSKKLIENFHPSCRRIKTGRKEGLKIKICTLEGMIRNHRGQSDTVSTKHVPPSLGIDDLYLSLVSSIGQTTLKVLCQD